MAINKVEIYVSQILEDLDNGLTWLKKDDLGYGSIQDKYNAKDQQIAMIRKHPALKDAETTVTVFTVIDDTKSKNNGGTITLSVTELENAANVESLSGTKTENSGHGNADILSDSNSRTSEERNDEVAAEDLSAFANL